MSKVTEDNFNLDDIIAKLDELDNYKVLTGPSAEDKDAHILLIASANEYGATITPKNGKALAIPLCKEARGKSPKDFDNLIRIGSVLHAKVGKKAGKKMFMLVKKVVIPERSFMRSTADDPKTIDHIVSRVQYVFNLFIAGEKPAMEVLNALGIALQDRIKKTIRSNIQPDNAPLTKELKGSGKNTLNDTGTLGNSIQFEVIHD